ncbi:MAG: hypothetical protein GQ583_11850 [Methyloprofundus sp.]|nr:hypothetical protein [Methyloprofundus sp.]
MYQFKQFIYLLLTALMLSQPSAVLALSAAELHQLINDGEKLTLIDIRRLGLYQESHIPNAINIPARMMENKQLPPIGRVVVYGDGVHTEITENAVIALNQKKGIQAEMLEGGMAVWQSFNMLDTQKSAMKKVVYSYITYAELLVLINTDTEIVLLDVRLPKEGQVLSDLAIKFPSVESIKPAYHVAATDKGSKFHLKPVMRRQKSEVPPLFILIDNVDARSEKVYRRLSAGRIKRQAILTGGELILSREGQGGQQKNTRSISGGLQ